MGGGEYEVTGGEGASPTDIYLPPSTFTGQFFKKSRHLGVGVFIIDICSVVEPEP